MLLLSPAWSGEPAPESGPPSVQNRFFLKARRFEIAPAIGYVPSNPFAVRYVGRLGLAWHASEELAIEADVSYAPDLGTGDLRPLVGTVLVIGSAGGGTFEQPLDKSGLAVQAAARWAPFYGKINLGGEAVVNLDVYGLAGLGVLSKSDYVATLGDVGIELQKIGTELDVGPVIGIGTDVFCSHSVALKLDLRDTLYVDGPPAATTGDGARASSSRLNHDLTATVGLSLFVPRMKTRADL